MYVCHCRAVTDRQIRTVIAGGATDLAAVATACGAGATCGGCLPAVRDLLEAAGHPCEWPVSVRTLRQLAKSLDDPAPAAPPPPLRIVH